MLIQRMQSDLDREIDKVESSLAELDALEREVDLKRGDIEKSKALLAELNENLKKVKDEVIKTEKELADWETKKRDSESKIVQSKVELDISWQDYYNKKANLDKSISKFEVSQKEERAKLDAERELLRSLREKLNERNESLDIYAAKLEEFRRRLVLIGVKRGGGVQPENIPEIK